MNIKHRLEAEADQIVEKLRAGEDGVNNLLAKHASERGYNADTVRSLTWLVNRHAFKKAMQLDRRDELEEIADAETVLFKLRSPAEHSYKAASYSPGLMSKVASVSDSGFNGRPLSVDYGPTLVSKLTARSQELLGEIKLASAQIREGLFELTRLAANVKRAGLEGTPGYRTFLCEFPESQRNLIEMVIEQSPVTKVAYTDPQLRMHIPAALENTKAMAKVAARVHDASMKLADCQERLRLVESQKADLKNGWRV